MSVKTYSFKKDGNTYLSKHFQVKEFGSFSGSRVYTDTVLIDSELVNKLEELFEYVNASKAIINSGYRCPAHDKAVGGSGSGQHVNGKAVDIVFYDQNGNVISTKYICCIASELQFNGIANISSLYRATHLDVRSGSKYWGDEIYNYSSIWRRNPKWTDFYKYWNLNRDEVLAKFKNNSSNIANENDSSKVEVEVEHRAKVTNGNWNVRQSPVTGNVMTVLKENTLVTYTKTSTVSDNNVWYYLNEYDGWISGKGLVTSNVTNSTDPKNIIITKGTWNVRKNPGSGTIITTVKNGEHYEFINTKEVGSTTWYQIKINNTTGWVSGKAVSKLY